MGWLQKSENKNPWGKKPDDNQGPPDLENAIKNFLGRKGKRGKRSGPGGSGGSGGGPGVPAPPFKWLALIVVSVGVIIWGLSGIYIVKPPERAAVLTFGRYSYTVGPGLHWYPRFIQSVTEVNVDSVASVTLDREILTSHENIVHVSFAVQYHVGNVQDYLYNTVNPRELMSQALDSAVRQVIGKSELQKILTISRKHITDQVETELNKLLKRYQAGISINEVIMQPARPPEAVKEAFDDVIKAREDRERLQNQAHSYANRVVPRAKGKAQRALDEAKAYKEQLILEARGNIARFEALLPEYRQNPEVVKTQWYFDTMQQVFGSSKVFVIEGDGNNNLFYWPGKRSKAGSQGSREQGGSQTDNSGQQRSAHSTGNSAGQQQRGNSAFPSYPSPDRNQYMRWLEANQ